MIPAEVTVGLRIAGGMITELQVGEVVTISVWVVAYTLLANHVPLETELIGAHEHESHYVFDICYHNTSDITPTTTKGITL